MKIYLAIYDDKKKQRDYPLQRVYTMKRARELNEQGYGIFGTVNSFHNQRREDDIKSFDYFYVDFDGSEKEKQLDALKNFLMPSMTIESKNGYHCYWKIADNLLEEYGLDMGNKMYKEINKRLSYWLGNGADMGVYDSARVLRVPEFMHLKNPLDPFEIKETFNSDIKYTVKEMLLWLKPRPKKESVKKEFVDVEVDGDNFWEMAHAIDCENGLMRLSGHMGISGDTLEIVQNQIYVNGERTQCWIDDKGFIGSHGNGGPTIPNWINWYHNDWSKTGAVLNEVFPELSRPAGITLGF